MQIRNEHRLTTLRLSLRPSRSGSLVAATSFLGDERVNEHTLPLADYGVPEESEDLQSNDIQPVLPAAVQQLCEQLAGELENEEPLWLQLGPRSSWLGILPWEALLGSLNVPVLRVPNFTALPTRPDSQLTVAICLSSPKAKEEYDLRDQAEVLVGEMGNLGRQADFHLFADAACHHLLVERFGGRDDVTIYDPAQSVPYGEGRTRTTSVQSTPWFDWMNAALRDTAIDHLHIVSPGYIRRNRGFLAVAQSPTRNVDRGWSHFIRSESIAKLASRLGAGSIGLTSPSSNRWRWGMRLVANELAQLRPGPILLHDAPHHEYEELSRALHIVFGEGAVAMPSSTIGLWTHPQRLLYYSHGDDYRGSWKPAPTPSIFHAMPTIERTAAPRWERSLHLDLNTRLRDLSAPTSARAAGELSAIEFVAGLLEEGS